MSYKCSLLSIWREHEKRLCPDPWVLWAAIIRNTVKVGLRHDEHLLFLGTSGAGGHRDDNRCTKTLAPCLKLAICVYIEDCFDG